VHRVGRTARAETTGEAITFVGDKDQRRFGGIEKLIEAEVPKLEIPQELGPGPAYHPERKESRGKGHSGNNRRRPPFRKKKGPPRS
jgi:superfamily II DNA/RNA helicase